MTKLSKAAIGELIAVAKRVNWFEPPETVISNEHRFLCLVMQYGTVDDILVTRRYYDEKAFQDALDNAEAGALDHRSWSYWNLVLNDDHERPYPVRRLP